MIWNFRGIYPHKKPDIFYGQRGLTADTGNPLPSATLAASAETVTTPGDITIQAYAVNTVAFQWQTSKDGEEWVNIPGQISKTLERFYPHVAGTAGTYFYRVLCAGWLGVVPSPAVSVVVSYAVPAVTITASAEHVPNAGTVTLTASARYTDSYAWQVSRDNAEWAYIGITTPEAVIEYAPEDGGEYFYRCEAVGLGGKVHSIPVSVEVEYHPPIISITADVTEIESPGTVTLTASAMYADSYTWQTSADGEVWSTLAGRNGLIASVSYAEGEAGDYFYRCIASGNGGQTVSEAVKITVSVPVIEEPETPIEPDVPEETPEEGESLTP